MKKAIKYINLIILHSLFYFVSFFIPKKRKMWVFGAWEGNNYTDNTRFMYEYILKCHQDIACAWITKNEEVYNMLSKRGDNVVRVGTLRWLNTILRASVAFETEGNADIGGYRPSRCKIVQLWHGYGGKNCKWYKKNSFIMDRLKKIVFDNRETSFWMVPSEYAIDSVKRNFFVPQKQCFLTGSPRNDYIKNPQIGDILTSIKESHPNCNKIIAYLPTHRNFGNDGKGKISKEQFSAINDYCVDRGYVFFFKPHFHEMKYYHGMDSLYKNIIIADANVKPEYSDLYAYLGHFDLLVSDYSSVIYDFLCTEKPVVLFPYDIEEYKMTDGIPDAYLRDPCGPLCYTWQDVFYNIDYIFREDQWQEARERNRKLIHLYNDGKNCERIYNTVIDLLD